MKVLAVVCVVLFGQQEVCRDPLRVHQRLAQCVEIDLHLSVYHRECGDNVQRFDQ